MKRFQTYFFDLDGTLIDHFGAIYRAHSHTLKTLGLPEPTWAEVRSAVGGGLERAIGRLAGAERVDEALAIYRPYWTETMLSDVQLLPGTRELLERLHKERATLAVLTNKHGPSSRLICDHLEITPLLRGVFGATDTPWLKPQPEFTRHALEQLGADASSAMLVGDSTWDVEAARNCGFPSWCVTTGTHSAEELTAAGADKIFPDLVALNRELS